MSYNLLEEAWLPVRRRSGGIEKIPPWRITCDAGCGDPVVAICSPRPDLDGGLLEFLIGLVQTCLTPERDPDWRRLRDVPPTPEELRTAFRSRSHAFDLDGDGPRFMQDLTLNQEQRLVESAIEALFIDAPGGKTRADGTDLFVKADGIDRLCRACAATTLLTLQTYAPSGGAGVRTSLRGGGPLTTLVLGDTLWRTVWNNVLPRRELEKTCDPTQSEAGGVFPWLASTRTSQDGTETHQDHVHPLHMFWAMPRRIRLEFEDGGGEACDLCGVVDSRVARRFRSRPHGYNYKGVWRHPLSPYRHMDKGDILSVKGSMEGTGYRYWQGLVFGEADQDGLFKNPVHPAQVVRVYAERAQGEEEEPFRLLVFGYDMDNMKALGWCQGEMPAWAVADPGTREFFGGLTRRLVRAAVLFAGNLDKSLKQALVSERAGAPKADAAVFSAARADFWARTEGPFYTLLREALGHIRAGEESTALREHWRYKLYHLAEAVFEDVVGDVALSKGEPQRIAGALLLLRTYCSAKNKLVKRILDLPEPQTQTDSETV